MSMDPLNLLKSAAGAAGPGGIAAPGTTNAGCAVGRADTKGVEGGAAAGERDFQSYLLDSLEEVNKLQQQAQTGAEDLVTGRTDNVAEVMGRIRKAEVAFSMLMEIRNKLIDAYGEIRQMRV